MGVEFVWHFGIMSLWHEMPNPLLHIRYKVMKLLVADSLAKLLIRQHLTANGYTGWSLAWSNSINSLGSCHYGTKTIKLSKKWTLALPKDEVRDTILHEIAHVIAGHEAGHGYLWKRACISIGAIPERLAKLDIKRSDIQEPTHQLILSTTGEVIKDYFRTPTKKTYAQVPHLYVTGRKRETLGKLVIKERSLLDLIDLT